MFENPRRSRQARNFTRNVPKILDLKSSSEQIFFGKFSLGAPGECVEVLKNPSLAALINDPKFQMNLKDCMQRIFMG